MNHMNAESTVIDNYLCIWITKNVGCLFMEISIQIDTHTRLSHGISSCQVADFKKNHPKKAIRNSYNVVICIYK